MFDRHLLRMQGSGIFFEEPELQCLADLFRRPIVVDAVVVATGNASRKAFEPKEATTGGNDEVVHLVLWVCTQNASHCEVVMKPTAPAAGASAASSTSAAAVGGATDPSSWCKEFTAEGEAYFYNEATGETSWDIPLGWPRQAAERLWRRQLRRR